MKRQEEFLATLDDYLEVELEEAKLNLEIAYNQFNHCDPEFVDYCVLQIEAAKAKLSAVLQNMKTGGYTNEQGNRSDSNSFVSNIIHRILGT